MMLRPLSFVAAVLALSSVACSDAPARPAKLGLYMMIKNPEQSLPGLSGKTCPSASGVEWDIGKAVKTNGMVTDVQSPSPTSVGSTIEDGKSGVDVTCTVRKNGSFNIDATGTDPQITPPDGLIRFTMGGTARKSAPTEIAVSVYTPRTLQIRTEPDFPVCTMTAVHEMDLGALWADFDCPGLAAPTEPNRACHASGTIVMEYCKTGEEED